MYVIMAPYIQTVADTIIAVNNLINTGCTYRCTPCYAVYFAEGGSMGDLVRQLSWLEPPHI